MSAPAFGLERMVAAKRIDPGIGSEEQIAAFAKRDVRTLAVDGEQVAGAAEEVDAEERGIDVDGEENCWRMPPAESAVAAR